MGGEGHFRHTQQHTHQGTHGGREPMVPKSWQQADVAGTQGLEESLGTGLEGHAGTETLGTRSVNNPDFFKRKLWIEIYVEEHETTLKSLTLT